MLNAKYQYSLYTGQGVYNYLYLKPLKYDPLMDWLSSHPVRNKRDKIR